MSYSVIHGVMMAAHKATKFTPADIVGPSRKAPLTKTRQAVMYVLRERIDWTLPHLGRYFGRDHSTVLHACRCVKEAIRSDWKTLKLVQAMIEAPEVSMAEYDRWLAGVNSEPVKVIKPLVLKPVAKGVPAPVKDLGYIAPSRLKWFSSMDEDGHCYGERYMQHDLRRGSEKLRVAIAKALAA